LLVAATLLARSFVRLTHVDAGYTVENVLTAEVFVPGGEATDKGPALRAVVDAVLARTRALPGVVFAGASNQMPLDNTMQLAGFPSPWTPPNGERKIVRSLQYSITPGYGEALGLRIKRGRLFTESDYVSGVRPYVVNEEFARSYLPPDPIGHRWTLAATPTVPERTNEIIGVVANTLKNGNDAPVQPEHYMLPRDPMRFYSRFEILARTTGEPSAVAPALRTVVRDVAPTAGVETVTLSQRFTESVDEPRFAMTILVTFALLALALASVGLYGVLSYGVSQRRREIGVRAALGAPRATLVRMVVRDGLAPTVVGLATGLVAAAVLTRLMQRVLFGVEPLDPLSFAAAPLLLLPVAIIASLVPARRAAATDPAEALKCE
jgi:predicted permease